VIPRVTISFRIFTEKLSITKLFILLIKFENCEGSKLLFDNIVNKGIKKDIAKISNKITTKASTKYAEKDK
jgi:hypothetical protein